MRPAALLLAVVCLVASCRQIIGIEEAQTDPSFGRSSAGQESAAGEAARGGSETGGVASGGAPSATGGVATAGENEGGASEAGPAGQAGQAGSGPDEGTVCERYCDAVLQSCTGEFAIYTSRDTCLAVCQALPEGMPGDRDVNTAHCRLRAASLAPDEVPHYCPIAGPGGNDGCGSNCEGLCSLRGHICAPYVTNDYDDCLAECSQLTDLGNFSVDLSANQYAGPHVQCRLYHLCAAANDDAEQHCLHADGAVPCQ